MQERHLTLRNGRRVSLAEYGDAAGMPVFALHGTPGSRLKFSSIAPAATRHGLRIIAPDRWGYGDTDAVRRPTLSGYAADILELADRHGIERFALLGISGGGPYAAVAANLAGERLTRLALVSPVGPVRLTEPREISRFHRFCFLALPHLPLLPRAAFEAFRLLLACAPATALRLSTAASVDRQVLRNANHRRAFVETFRLGFTRSAQGPALDVTAFAGSWEIASHPAGQARLWIGSNDLNVPVAAARTLAHLTGAHLVELPAAGHYWFSEHHDAVLGWLAESAERSETIVPSAQV